MKLPNNKIQIRHNTIIPSNDIMVAANTDFRFLDNNFIPIENVKAINVQWRRRYYEYGDFEIQMLVADYSLDFKYVWNMDTNEVGIIQKRNMKTLADGNFMYLSGYFVEQWLGRGVVVKNPTLPANIVTVSNQLVRERVIQDLGLSRIQIGTSKTTSQKIEAFEDDVFEIGSITQGLLKSLEYSQKLRFDTDAQKFYYDIWQGIDRSQEGQLHCLFSTGIGNINEVDYTDDESDYKNYAEIVIDRGENHSPQYLYTSYSLQKAGEELSKLRLNLSDTESETDTQAIAAAKDQGLLELLNHTKLTNMSFEPLVNSFVYRKDYDLGDLVNSVFEDLEISIALRIVEIDELYKNNEKSITLQFGDTKKLSFIKGRY